MVNMIKNKEDHGCQNVSVLFFFLVKFNHFRAIRFIQTYFVVLFIYKIILNMFNIAGL